MKDARGETPPLPKRGSHKGWYVPHKLPHLDAPGMWQAVTFRLADALPKDVVRIITREPDRFGRRKIAALLDAGLGACLLRDPTLAALVEQALFNGAAERYDLHAFVIMPNHVHALIAPHDDEPLQEIVQRWKSWSAKAINRERGGSGTVWQREYFDRYMRDDTHFEQAVHYIEANPVQAGLATDAAAWRFGSAWWKARSGEGKRDGGTPSLQEGASATQAR